MHDPNDFSVFQKIASWTRLVLGFSFIILCSVPYVLLALLMLPSRRLRIYSGNIYGKIVGPVITRIAGARVQIANKARLNDQKPAIYVTNHSSELDPFVGMWLCPLGGCGIAKKEVARVPFFGWAYRLSGHLLIDRSDREKAIASMAEVGEVVRQNGLSIWLWPEGTRSQDGRLQPFKKGFAHLALATGLPIVPVVMHDGHKRWPGRSTRMYPGPLHIDVLPSVDTSSWTTESIEEHVRQVRQIFLDTLAPHQRPQQNASA